ncbi:MAG: hypothetical protein JWL59_960 [Chthoniobacteraceae bacterium]|nr:hypothetical protein [Chthoniobacteraceae bacterium]
MINRFLLSFVLMFSGCALSHTGSGVRGSLAPGQSVQIVATSDDHDPGIKNAISSELAQRSIGTVEQKAQGALSLTYYDDWKWDLVMYLWTLDLKLSDATGRPLATANFHHKGLHSFPNNRLVVKTLFEKWDEAGVFKR